MRYFLLTIFVLAFLASCQPEQEFLTPAQINLEKEKVTAVVEDFTKAMDEKNYSDLLENLASDIHFFGTDSSEIINTFPHFKKSMEKQWASFEYVNYGDMQDIQVFMDSKASWASIIFGMPIDLMKNGKQAHLFLRVQRTLRKENKRWLIRSGIVGVVNTTSTPQLEEVMTPKKDSTLEKKEMK